MLAPLPLDEQQRLRLLGELRILDTPPEPSFDAIARLAVELSGCAIGAVCFVDAERLWLKASVGIDATEVRRDAGFCAHTILGREPVLVEDASHDPRFASIPLVTQPPAIRNYAAAPVVVEGHAVATVAVFDPRARPLDDRLRTGLVDLAKLAADLLQARLAAQRARLQEARVRTASRASSDWLWESDADGLLTWMSDSAIHHLGAQAQLAIGRPWTAPYSAPPRHGESWRRCEQAQHRREPFKDLIVERERDDGRTLLIGFGGMPVFDTAGSFRGYRGAARDVTTEMNMREAAERNAAELALSEERWKFALDVSIQGVWDWDLAGQTMYVSPGWRALLGIDDGDWQPASPTDWRRRIHPDDVDAARARLQAHLRGETAGYAGEYRMRHRDGRWLWVLNRGKVVQRDASGRATRAVGTLVDVTERRAAELALRDKQAAELASAAKSRFLSRMSHEMRTPLNAMLGFTQLLLDAPVATDAERVRDYAAHSLRAGQQLLDLVDGVLDLQRVDEGRLDLRIEALALTPLVACAVEAVKRMADARGVHLHIELPDGLHVQADAARLLQVINNLSSNAVKYNRPAGHVRWFAQVEGDTVTLVIDDSGAGLTQAQMARLFQPFERLGRETGPIEGTGLGLILARSLIEKMGGQLRLTSRPGLGTRAMIDLPLASVPAPPAEGGRNRPAAAAVAPSDAPLQLLYVEDNRVNALLFGEAVRVLGNVELRIAEDGSEAIETVRDWRPDVLVLDAHLPGMSGYEVLERLRSVPGLESVPAYMCSADAMPDDMARARAAGFVGYWTKPIDVGRIIGELRQLAAAGR